MQYRGRFAPSPTGPLHMGSLLAALGSYLQAKSHRGEWLVRIEDLDPPREVQGASEDILRTLERFGFEWDGAVVFQSRRHELYTQKLEHLAQIGKTYPCSCSRAELDAMGIRGPLGLVYPGICRERPSTPKSPYAIRVKTRDEYLSFLDGLQGEYGQNLLREVGDFVLKRVDSLFAYQLAVVVDDAEQAVTEVVRGSDLLDSTPRQIYLQGLLGYSTPSYIHLPLLTNRQGEKLSKQTHARAINPDKPLPELIRAMTYLGHTPPLSLQKGNTGDFWEWAMENWNLHQVVKSQAIVEDHESGG